MRAGIRTSPKERTETLALCKREDLGNCMGPQGREGRMVTGMRLRLPGTETGTREEPERRAGTGTRRGHWMLGGRAGLTGYEDLTMRGCGGHSTVGRGRTNRT